MTTSIIGVTGIETTTPAFRAALVRTAQAIGIDPDHLATVISFETGGSFDPTETNPKSGAIGLIQFTSAAIVGPPSLGTTRAALAQMTAEQQLDYVRRYYAIKNFAPGHSHSLEDTYYAVIWPAAIGKAPGTILMQQGSTALCPGTHKTMDDCYNQNIGFDVPQNGVRKGYITASDIGQKIRARYQQGLARPRVAVVGGGLAVPGGSGGAAIFVLALGAGAAYLYSRRNRR